MHYLLVQYGYPGIFLGLLASNAIMFVPVPGIFLLLMGGTFLNPVLVAVVGGLGGALGKMTSYLSGRAGRRFVGRESDFAIARKLHDRYGSGIVYLFAATPLPFDFIGMICGLVRADPRKFLLLVFLGRTTLYMIYAYSGLEAWDVLSSVWTRHFNPAAIPFLLVAGGFIALVLWFWTTQVREASAKLTENS